MIQILRFSFLCGMLMMFTLGMRVMGATPMQWNLALAAPATATAAQLATADALTPQQTMAIQAIMMESGRLRNQPPLLTAGPHYLYMLRNGMLAQYNSQTFKLMHQLAVFGALPAKPAANAPVNVRIQFGNAVIQRLAAATICFSGEDLVIATCDLLCDVDATTLQLKSRTIIALPAQVVMPYRLMDLLTPPVLQVIGSTAYILHMKEHLITTVNLTRGTLIGHNKLPDSMTPTDLVTVMALFQQNITPNGAPVGPVEAPKTVTLVGTIHHIVQDGDFWAFDDRNGEKYALSGEKLKVLIATPNLDEARIRITGTINNTPAVALYGNGILTITDYQVMPAAL